MKLLPIFPFDRAVWFIVVSETLANLAHKGFYLLLQLLNAIANKGAPFLTKIGTGIHE